MNEPRTAAGRELRTRLLDMFGAWQKLARSVPMHVPEIEDPKGWIAAIEQEAAATERQNTVERIRQRFAMSGYPCHECDNEGLVHRILDSEVSR